MVAEQPKEADIQLCEQILPVHCVAIDNGVPHEAKDCSAHTSEATFCHPNLSIPTEC
jgi:hypothetical protein